MLCDLREVIISQTADCSPKKGIPINIFIAGLLQTPSTGVKQPDINDNRLVDKTYCHPQLYYWGLPKSFLV